MNTINNQLTRLAKNLEKCFCMQGSRGCLRCSGLDEPGVTTLSGLKASSCYLITIGFCALVFISESALSLTIIFVCIWSATHLVSLSFTLATC